MTLKLRDSRLGVEALSFTLEAEKHHLNIATTFCASISRRPISAIL